MLTSVTIVDQRDDREQGEDPQHDVDDHGLRARDELGPDDVHAGHHDDDQRRKNLRPHLVLAGDRGAGVAAERDRHHRRHDGVHKVDQPRGGPGEMTVAEPLGDVLQQAAGARIPRAELGEGVALQDGDRPGKEERQPHRRARYRAGRAQEREDPRAHHRPDADERGLAHVEVCDPGCR